MDDCIFCQIAAKKIPSKIIYEDEEVIAFEDIKPQAPVHLLVIPREHFSSLNQVPAGKEALLGKILLVARKIAEEKGVAESGYRIVLNTAADSGQEVLHLHFHLLGGRRMTWPPG
ncbi:MAG: histidine triad nucleotide-binding protein [Candidatus Aminicenantes bacterium 4484_214]|nr:MAG: histidine triad nucleotide-binding protein [Candidatus Aminicenantes bacterium 4484_214]RLE07032.1 MAG: histidine triad nucleotide-binding protein [Candidatus Aminicenantes bacterium]HDJ23307.1 histidine triad nucleotide-binding protein [Candidatus Aminicenantes bacterium]